MTLKTLIATGAAALTMVLPALAAPDAHAATVRVPLDRANPSAGQISLYVRRLPATQRRRRTLLYIAGGPGSSATAEVRDVVASLGDGLRRSTEVVAFDARGMGRSGVFVCPELQRDATLRSTSAAAACARRLGSRRSSSTVVEQVEDIEAVRRALKVRRLDLLGISYGTEVAQRYAQAHPDRVGRIVLDSVLPPEGPSALGLEVFAGMERVLRAICTRGRCARGVPPIARELPALVPQLRATPLRAPVVDARGRAKPATLDPVALLDALLAGDFNPALRQALPAAVAAARRGDAAPLLRLVALDRAATPTPRTREFSNGAYAATSCESLEFPWDAAADPQTRRAQAAERVAAMGAEPFAPFDGQTVLDGDFLPLCLAWPAPARPVAAPPRALPPVPMLLIAGAEDLRTPVETARASASRDPRARLLVVGGAGHSVLTADETGCAARAARAFLVRAGPAPPRTCRGPEPFLPPVRTPPAALGDLGGGSTTQRTVRAIDATLDDVVLALSVGGARGGGLRAGRFFARGSGIVLRGYEYVPGVVLDATPRRGGAWEVRVRGSAAARGTVVLERTGRLTGTLGGRRVRTALEGGPPRI